MLETIVRVNRQEVVPVVVRLEVVVPSGMMTWSQWVAYIDVVVEAGLEPGWRSVRLQRVGAEPVEAPVRILAPDVRLPSCPTSTTPSW